jgi:hypothetical protein
MLELSRGSKMDMRLTRQEESRMRPLFIQNNATFQKEGGNPPHFKSS